MTESAPAQVGPYIPQQLLAMGAQAQVWLATGPDGEVALKVARGADGRRGLRREAEVLASSHHRNLVRLVEAGPDGEWLALERIEGLTIDHWAQQRPIDDVIDAAIQLVDALEYLHGRGWRTAT